MTLAVVIFAAALAGLLIGVASAWRHIQREAPGLPLWRALKRVGVSRTGAEERAGSRALRQAELRCMFCAHGADCRARVARRLSRSKPCPNEHFFSAVTGSLGRR